MKRTRLLKTVLALSFVLASLLAMPGCFWWPGGPRDGDRRGDMDHRDDHQDIHQDNHGGDQPHDNGGNR